MRRAAGDPPCPRSAGVDKDGEPNARENTRFVLVDADVHKSLHEHLFAYLVDTTLELGDQRVGAGPATNGALGFMVDFERVTPVKEFIRTATEDRAVVARTIPAGDAVYLVYLSANRDETVFAAPCRFDVARPDNEQLAFADGVHFCLSAHLARLEMRVFFEELLTRVEDIQLAGEPKKSATVFVGGLKHLPISYQVR